VPASRTIYEKSGYVPFYEQYGDDFSWGAPAARLLETVCCSRPRPGMCPRAKIFRARAETVTDVTSMQKLLRYNDYLNDPLSQGNPGSLAQSPLSVPVSPFDRDFVDHAICSRGDLASHPSKGGCYDSKARARPDCTDR
jgi:hypothetical protein